MANEELLEQIHMLLETNNGKIREEIQAAKTEIIGVIRKAEGEIIETLKMTTGELATKQDDHETRISQLESKQVPRSH